jgi:maltose O-acetyltransferase
MTTERERMLRGELYDARDDELLAMAHRARALLGKLSHSASTDAARRAEIFSSLFGGAGEGVWIEPPFFCDYGAQIVIGADTFLNTGCVFLDSAEIRIGASGLIGPGVQLLTVSHPLRAADRVLSTNGRASGRAPYRTQARPIRIGDNAWIGAGTIVLPGVTIGDNVTIGAGSVVNADIPSDSLALGMPCRVQRAL